MSPSEHALEIGHLVARERYRQIFVPATVDTKDGDRATWRGIGASVDRKRTGNDIVVRSRHSPSLMNGLVVFRTCVSQDSCDMIALDPFSDKVLTETTGTVITQTGDFRGKRVPVRIKISPRSLRKN